MTHLEHIQLQKEKLALKQKQLELQEGLPHLYGQKFYKWQREFWDSRNRTNCLTAGNQSGKSSISIRKCIHWATAQDLWSSLWRKRPNLFFYLYPDYGTTTREYETKWLPEFLPRGKFRDDPIYGWEPEFEKKDLKAIRFKSGVTVYFLAYAQMVKMMQASTAYAVFADEEIPESLYTELRFRLMAVRGYFHAAFTATLGQEFWRCVMEERGQGELLPDARKWQIDIEKDCRFFEDGSPSHWTDEAVREAIAACPTPAEVLRRIRGKFVIAEGRRYPSFNRARNVKPVIELVPADWNWYAAADLGAGTEHGHPSAITFIAVRPDYRKGRVFMHWNGKGVQTTAADVFTKFLGMRGQRRCVAQSYDFSARDFGTIAQRAGETFLQANKNRTLGDDTLNSLFKNEMLDIDDIEENFQLIKELENANDRDRKQTALDDSVDSARYCSVSIPWDWIFLNPDALPKEEQHLNLSETERRRSYAKHQEPDELDSTASIESEISFWNDYLES